MRRPLDPDSASGTADGEDTSEEQAQGGQETWTGGPARTAAAVTVLLWACFLAGPAALGWLALSGSSPAAPPASVVDRSRERTLAGETALAWVIAWLTIPRDRAGELEGFGLGAVSLPQVPATVSGVGIAAAGPAGPRVWSVTVGAEVTDPPAVALAGAAPAAAPVAVRRYFQVPVLVTSTSAAGSLAARVLTLPAPVPAPARAEPPRMGYDRQVPSGSPLVPAVRDFLSALVAGTGDVTRYITPGSPIRPVSPPPATAVRVTELLAVDGEDGLIEQPAPADGRTVRVLATVELSGSAGQQQGAQFALTLTARAGRWEVSAVDPAPVVRARAAAPSPAFPPQTPTTP